MSFFSRILISLICLGSSACSGSESIRGADSTLFPYLRTSVPFGNYENERAALEIDASGGRGEDTQDIEAGEVVEVTREEFIGPGQVQLDFDLLAVTAQGRFRIYEIGPVRAEVMAGAGFQRLKLEAEFGSLQAMDNVSTIGPLVGGGINIRPLDWVDIQVRWRTVPIAVGETVSSLSRFEASTLFRVAPHVKLVAGWTRWRYVESLVDSKGETDLRLSGFFGGLEFFK